MCISMTGWFVYESQCYFIIPDHLFLNDNINLQSSNDLVHYIL